MFKCFMLKIPYKSITNLFYLFKKVHENVVGLFGKTFQDALRLYNVRFKHTDSFIHEKKEEICEFFY